MSSSQENEFGNKVKEGLNFSQQEDTITRYISCQKQGYSIIQIQINNKKPQI